jgi:hypothetical protein
VNAIKKFPLPAGMILKMIAGIFENLYTAYKALGGTL